MKVAPKRSRTSARTSTFSNSQRTTRSRTSASQKARSHHVFRFVVRRNRRSERGSVRIKKKKSLQWTSNERLNPFSTLKALNSSIIFLITNENLFNAAFNKFLTFNFHQSHNQKSRSFY